MRIPSHFFAVFALSAVSIAGAAPGSNQSLASLEAQAKQGDPRAQTELAVKYEYAEGLPLDLQRARRLFCSAATQGYAEAQFQLGWLYANGRGVPRDDSVAAALFTLAANQGHEYARRMLRYVQVTPDARLPQCLRTEAADEAEQSSSEGASRVRGPIVRLVYRLAPHYGVDPKLALAVIAAESDFDDSAVSPKNAQGLMQLIPETAQRFRVKSTFDPEQNVKGGLAYLRWLLAYFRGNVPFVLAAYNAGERAVDRYRGIPPYAETREYVRKVTRVYQRRTAPFDPAIVGPSPIVEEPRASSD
jgi:hypothetical protein